MSLITPLATNATCIDCYSTTNENPFMNLLVITTAIHFTLMSYWEPSFAIVSTIANVSNKFSNSNEFTTVYAIFVTDSRASSCASRSLDNNSLQLLFQSSFEGG